MEMGGIKKLKGGGNHSLKIFKKIKLGTSSMHERKA